MRGRNEQPNRTKWTYLASPRINKQQQMTAYVRPFLRRRFHRSGSRSVKDPPSPPPPPPSPPSRFRDFTSVFLSLSYSLSFSLSLRTERERVERTSFSVILAPSSRLLPDPGPPAVTLRVEAPEAPVDHSRDHRYRSLDLSLRSPLFLFSVGCSGGGRGRLGIEDSGFEEGFELCNSRESFNF